MSDGFTASVSVGWHEDGRPRVTELIIWADDGAEITWQTLRKVSLPDLIAETLRLPDPPNVVPVIARRGHAPSTDTLRAFATLHASLKADPRTTARATTEAARRFGISRATAIRWRARAGGAS